jgi:hypothetical protein
VPDNANTIDTWVDALSTQLASLRDGVMRVDDVASLFNGTLYGKRPGRPTPWRRSSKRS